MKMRHVIGIIALGISLGAGVLCEGADNGKTVEILSPAAATSREYEDAVKLFLNAKRSDNPEHNYSACIGTLRKIVETADNPELRIHGSYFLALALFLQRDFSEAALYAKKVLSQGKEMYKTDTFAMLAGNLAAKLEEEVSFDEVMGVMVARKADEAALLAGALRHYSLTTDAYADNHDKVKAENLDSTVIVLSLYAIVFKLPMDAAIEKAHQAECVSHLHKLIAAWRKYRQDHEGKPVPVSVRISSTGKNHLDLAPWTNLLQAYIDDPLLKDIKPLTANILLSPGTELSCPGRTGKAITIESLTPNYGMNYTLFDEEGKSLVTDQSMIFIDSKSVHIAGPSAWGLENIDFCHSDGADCAFADGRVDWLSRPEIEKSAKAWDHSAPWNPAITDK